MGKGLYELKNKSGKTLQKKVNVIRLKRFYSNNVRLLFNLCNSIYLIFPVTVGYMPLHLQYMVHLEHLEFDQTRMRNHLLQCFRKRELVQFPTIRKCSRRNNHFPYREVEVFCSCLMPESYGDMIQCDKCEQWYHIRCIGLSSIPRDTELWNCHYCC